MDGRARDGRDRVRLGEGSDAFGEEGRGFGARTRADDDHVEGRRSRSGLIPSGLRPRAIVRSMANMERVTGIGGVFQRADQAAGLRDWYAEHLGIDLADWGGKPFEWTPGFHDLGRLRS